jgi:hypothetical protein
MPVERGVLDTLGRHRRRRLLEPRHELVETRPTRSQQQHLGQLFLDARRGDRLPIELIDPPGPGLHVRAVHGQRGEGVRDAIDVEQGADSRHLPPERRRGLLELRLMGHLGERPVGSGQRRQNGLPRRIDVQGGDVVEELVAHRALHRPVAQRLSRMQDLLDPYARRARIAQAPQVAGRVRQAIRMVDPQPVHDPVAHELQHLAVHELEHVVTLDAHGGEIVDVEEAPVPAVGGVVVEDLRPALLVGPPAVLVAGAHVVRDDVQHDPQPLGGELAQARLASEQVRDARRVDDVVPVRRTAARLQRGRQVEVRDPQVAQVGHELAHRREVELRRQLQPVRRAQHAHREGSLSGTMVAVAEQ